MFTSLSREGEFYLGQMYTLFDTWLFWGEWKEKEKSIEMFLVMSHFSLLNLIKKIQ